jgi:hypothetical protein
VTLFRFNTRRFGLVRCDVGALLAGLMRAQGSVVSLPYAAFRAGEMCSRRTPPRAHNARKESFYRFGIRRFGLAEGLNVCGLCETAASRGLTLRFTCAATLERDERGHEKASKVAPRSQAAQRRQLQAVVRRGLRSGQKGGGG